MAKLVLHLQDYLSNDHRTLAALACTEKAAAVLARPLLTPLKPRWFLSFYGRDFASEDAMLERVRQNPNERGALECALKRYVQLELRPESFAVVYEDESVRNYSDNALKRAVSRGPAGSAEIRDNHISTVVVLRGFSGQRFAYDALSSYVEGLLCVGDDLDGGDGYVP